MENLPEEILTDILDYLDPPELLSVQRTCVSLSKSAHANPLWRYKCFEKSPSASMRNADGTLNTLTSALQSLTISDRPPRRQDRTGDVNSSEHPPRESQRARAVNQWDLSDDNERVDWYSEYKGRHAPLNTHWLIDPSLDDLEIKGIASLDGSSQVVGYLEDSSVCIWDVSEDNSGRRKFRELGRSKPSALFADAVQPGESLIVDCVSTFPTQRKAFIAVGNVLNEVDLDILKVVSSVKYKYPITALSQTTSTDLPLTIGTQWSLHILDPRIPAVPSTGASQERVEETSSRSTAILPDLSGKPNTLSSTFGPRNSLSTTPDPYQNQNHHWMTYAKVEPGPLSILHHAENDILIAGRFPSILSYDRRYFPRLQYVIHSGGSLSGLTSIPYPPAGASASVNATSTLIACGEYRGRGSLELYSLPHVKANGESDSATNNNSPSSEEDGMDFDLGRSSRGMASEDGLFSYKNRQQAAKSKLLSVAPHGTKIVFSDSEGGLKWVERDGRSLIRKWNINGFQVGQTGASLSGDQVVRKIIPLNVPDSERGRRGDSDLLIWTGERVAIVSTNPLFANHEELVKELEEGEDVNERKERERAEAYSKTMRQALERQADERRWMSQFRLKKRDFF
ncbi:hypothetical protein A1O1_07124 [Capronia coronata CBS 617.96]|uniref:F-box domain-containing protein n=1 Tax=Capronia coronata CBS 617.96 TaxID=1182541 RepID=W9Y2P6_9EURO|nr:uncharacterized protein A1O1_07124 [Capronia coronata CBS 617.96]EXJ83501.1 hypothetical protein A1O1_07124 [Capronia coronata CBS 617.96]